MTKYKRHVMLITSGKYKNQHAVIHYKTKLGWYVYLIDKKLTTLERLSFGPKGIVYGIASSPYKRVYVQDIVSTDNTICFDFEDKSSNRLSKYFGKSKSQVLKMI
jgi:hypothetical protein